MNHEDTKFNKMTEIKKTAAAVTLGCRLNQADTALIFGRLKEAGYEILESDTAEPLDLIIINSCAFFSF